MDSDSDSLDNDDLVQLRYGRLLEDISISSEDAEVITRQRSPRLADRTVEFGDFIFRDDKQTHKPRLVRVSPRANCRELVELMVTEMHALPPNLVLSVLTKPNDPKIFRLVHQTEQFIVGMEKVIESTSLWIITNGQNCGINKVIGFSSERYLERFDYQNRWCEVLRKQINKFRNVLLIGFIDEEALLSKGAKYKRVAKRLRCEINRKTFGDERMLNWNHSLFVIVKRDDDYSGNCDAGNHVDSFRCKLEHYLFGHTVPRLQLIDHHRAMQPRKLQITSVKTYESHVTVTIRWDNPYFDHYLNEIFETFEISVVVGGREARRIAMKPKGKTTTCELVLKSPLPARIVFAVQSKTLYGRSEETKMMIDIEHLSSNQTSSMIGLPSKLPGYMRSLSSYRAIHSSQSMDIECSPSSHQVTVSFVPFHPTTFHSIRVMDSDGNLVGSRALEACLSRCQFSGLKPDTEYNLSISAYWIAPGQTEKCIGGPFVCVFRTKTHVSQCYDCKDNKNKPIVTPLIYLIFGGGAETIKVVRHHLETKSAAMVNLAGTRGAANLIEVVINIFKTSPDKKEINGFVRRLLTRHVRMEIPGKQEDPEYEQTVTELVDDLLYIGNECAKTKRIRISNVWNTKLNMEKISKEFVKSWIIGGGKKGKDQNGFIRDTKLALDLNNCNVAKAEIFENTSRYSSKNITSILFELALLTKEREAFVDLFLEYNFEIHKYLTEDKLKYIFEYEDDVDPYDRDFFITTTVEGIMGLTGDEDKLPDDFISEQLPDVIRHLTGLHTNFVGANPRIIFMVKSEDDVSRPDRKPESYVKLRNKAIVEREREALKMLTVYALLMNRFELAIYLWKHSSSPLLTALFCASVYKRLSEKCHESYQKSLALDYSSKFTDLAVKLLDLSFTENEQITHEGLQCKYPDWNDRSPIEFAHGVANKEFMAHPSCQKWITRTYFGGITLRETTLGIWHVPDFMKILACSLLVFPMYFWINFSPIGKGDSMESKSSCKIIVSGSDRLYGDHLRALSIAELGGLFRPPRNQKSAWRRLRSFLNRPVSQGCTRFSPSSSTITDRGHEEKRVFGRIEKSKQQSRFDRRRAIFISRVVASPPFWKKLMLLWGAPVTKFTTDGFFYLLYLILFSLVSIWPTCGNLVLDLGFWIWTASITFENARLCYTKSKTINHLPLSLSVIDVLMQFSFLTAFGYMKFFELWEGWPGSSPSNLKALMGLFLVYFFLRVFRQYYPIHPKLGPAMVKLTYMITDDFISYLYIFAVFMLSVGVAATAIIHPHHPLNRDLMTRILRRGIMALFRTDIRDLEGIDPGSCKINITKGSCSQLSSGLSFMYRNRDIYSAHGIIDPGCAMSTWIAWVMVLAYGYMSSVFLRSLLTAMFGITGRNVSAISEQIWMYDRYEIIMDYERKPRLPPPLSILSYLMSGMAYIYKKLWGLKLLKLRRRSSHFEPDSGSFQEFVGMLSEFTRGDTSEWGQPRWEDDKGNQYWKLKAEKVFEMTQSKDKNEQRLKMLNIKSDIIQRATNEEASSLGLMRELIEEIVSGQKSEKVLEKRLNVLSRTSPYPNTRISRLYVRDDQVLWENDFGEIYDPVVVEIEVDPSLLRGVGLSQGTSLIEIEDDDRVEDTIAQIQTDSRNPSGRTGARGRGCLLSSGANKFIILLITRRLNRTTIQFYRRRNSSDWTALLWSLNSYANLCLKVNQAIFNSMETASTNHRFGRSDLIDFMGKAMESAEGFRFSIIHNGYLDDRRNTDDSWIEAEVWNFHFDHRSSQHTLFSEEAYEWVCLDPFHQSLAGLASAIERLLAFA